MPFPSYDMGDIAAFAEDDKYYDSILEQRRQLLQPVTEPLEIAPVVAKLENDYRRCKRLCNEILATLVLDGNSHLFAAFPADWQQRVEAWQQRADKLS
jgi:hypothetical protein